MKWLAPAVFAAHAVDEFFSGFPEWATRHFGTTSRRFYVASHAVLIAGVIGCAVAADRHRADPRLQTALGAIATAFVANGLFHLETTWRFRGLSPGILTGTTLMIPGGMTMLHFLIRTRGLEPTDAVRAVIGGVLLNATAVGSLRLDMPELRGLRLTSSDSEHHRSLIFIFPTPP